MKTIEEKAKAYHAARERASLIKGYKTLTPQETVEYIFPDLKESEDERIISSIIDVLENNKKHYLKEIAWLEKQKEQKPAEWLEEELVKYIGYPEENLDGKWKKKEVEDIARHFAEWGAEHLKK